MKPKCWPWAHVTCLTERGGWRSVILWPTEEVKPGIEALTVHFSQVLFVDTAWRQLTSISCDSGLTDHSAALWPPGPARRTREQGGTTVRMEGGVLKLPRMTNKNTVCLCSHKERKRREEVGDQGSRASVKVQREVWESTNKLRLQTYASWNYCNAMAVVLACLKEAACVSIVCLLNYK